MAEKQAYILGMDIGDTVMNFAGCIKKYIENCQKEGKEVAAVSIGCPSVVDRERRTLLSVGL